MKTINEAHFVHPKVSNKVATRLGVKSLRGLLIESVTDPMSLKMSLEDTEQFGQHEELISRYSPHSASSNCLID